MKKNVLIFTVLFLSSQIVGATPTRDFIKACTYGVLTGTLVGAASLAFEDQPGENLQQVARGASLGLYLGIGLGLYILYGVDDDTNPEEELLEEFQQESRNVPRFYFHPIISQNKVDGWGAQVNVMTF
ncbi:MAG: hypothetical protein R2827_10330 [Bdellovibrionales bacterium]